MRKLFCDKCGKILEIETKGENITGICSCGFAKEVSSFSFREMIKKAEEKAKGVFENKEEDEGFPHVCKKCGCMESDVCDLGAPYSDESNIYLFKCKKCGYVERQADGSGNL